MSSTPSNKIPDYIREDGSIIQLRAESYMVKYIMREQLTRLDIMAQYNINFNQPLLEKETPLVIAVQGRKLNAVIKLLELGADPNIYDPSEPGANPYILPATTMRQNALQPCTNSSLPARTFGWKCLGVQL